MPLGSALVPLKKTQAVEQQSIMCAESGYHNDLALSLTLCSCARLFSLFV